MRESIRRIARFRPLLLLGVASAIFMLVATNMSASYDDGGIGSAVFAVGQVVAIPYNAVYAVLTIGQTSPPRYFDLLSILFGFALFVVADLMLVKAARRE